MRRVLWCCCTVLALSACGAADAAGGAPRAAAAPYPLAWIAESVAPNAELTLLGSTGGDPHDLELSPSERAAVHQADVVLFAGELGLMPQVEQAVSAATGEVVDAAQIAGDGRLLPFGAAAADRRPRDDRDGRDPHLWLDPGLMAEVAHQAGEAFAAVDPSAAAHYRTNAQAIAEQLTALDGELAALLGGTCRHHEVIVSHEAYAYLLAPHGKTQRGIAGAVPSAGASGAALAALAEDVRARDIPAVLAEPGEGRSDAEALAREAGVDLLEVTPLEQRPEDHGVGYPALLRELAQTFAVALGCR